MSEKKSLKRTIHCTPEVIGKQNSRTWIRDPLILLNLFFLKRPVFPYRCFWHFPKRLIKHVFHHCLRVNKYHKAHLENGVRGFPPSKMLQAARLNASETDGSARVISSGCCVCISVKEKDVTSCVLKPWTGWKKTLAVIFFTFLCGCQLPYNYTKLLHQWQVRPREAPGARSSASPVERDHLPATSYKGARRCILWVVVTGDCGKCSLETPPCSPFL